LHLAIFRATVSYSLDYLHGKDFNIEDFSFSCFRSIGFPHKCGGIFFSHIPIWRLVFVGIDYRISGSTQCRFLLAKIIYFSRIFKTPLAPTILSVHRTRSL